MGNEFNLSDTPASRYTDQGGKRPRCAAGNPAKGPAPVNALDVLRTFKPNLTLIRETLPLPEDTQYILFSAEKGTGRGELLSRIEALI